MSKEETEIINSLKEQIKSYKKVLSDSSEKITVIICRKVEDPTSRFGRFTLEIAEVAEKHIQNRKMEKETKNLMDIISAGQTLVFKLFSKMGKK